MNAGKQRRTAGKGETCRHCNIPTDRISWLKPPDRPHYEWWDRCPSGRRLYMPKVPFTKVPKAFQHDTWDEADAGAHQHITREQADATGLAYRVEVMLDGTIVTVGRDSPWW